MTGKTKDRRPAVAALLSLVLMGLGQLYNGQIRRAVMFFSLALIPSVFVGQIPRIFFSFQGFMILYLGMLAYLGIKIFAIINAFVVARRAGAVELRHYNRWYVYLSVYASIFLVTAIIPTVFESPFAAYSVSSGSMHPTMLVGDYVLVDKSAYSDRAVQRGDVAVFWEPRRREAEYIMRIVGLPGDKIQMITGVLHINAKPVTRERIEDYEFTDHYGNRVPAPQYVETLPNGSKHRILEVGGDSSRLDSTGVSVVPEVHYFAMGDNRDNSRDSRFIGFVPAENLIGRAEITYFSLDNDVALWQVWRWPGSIRYQRIGSKFN